MSSKLNHIKGALASVFLWNSSFRSKCWVHCSFTAETVKSSFPIFLESASSIHSHGQFLWGWHFAERVSVCRRKREREPLPWCRPAFPGPAVVSSSSPATLSPSISLSLCLYVFIFLSCRTTVSAFWSLLMWLVMSSFSFAVPYVPPFPLDWSSLFNLLLYPPNSINSFSEFLFLPHRKPLIVRGECIFAWPLDSCSIQNLSPGVRGIPQFIAFFLCHGKS